MNEIYLREAKRGVNNEFIYDNYIREQYHISRSTFYEYLTVPYEKELKELDRREADEQRQNPTLNFEE